MEKFLKYKLDYLLVVLLSFPILFLKLGSFSLRLWDESIYATNAIEMMERGEWIVPYFKGEMDYWNTKPPLMMWLQIISMKIFGINEFAIRIPSALAALATLLLVYWFVKKHFSQTAGMFAALVLLTSVGFVTFHGARTGDTDALLAFFITAMNLVTLDLLLTKAKINKKLILIFTALALGFLTKSIAAFLFLPAILIFMMIYEKPFLKDLLSNRIFWISCISSLLLVGTYVMTRNSMQPGYFISILKNDVGRIGVVIEKHQEPFNFYLDNMVIYRFSYWIIFGISAFVLLFVKDENESRRKVLIFTALLFLFYFIFISFSITKLAWYDIPLFPILTIMVALFFHTLFEKIQLSFRKSVLALAIIFFIPYKHVFGLSQTNQYSQFEMKNEVRERYLKKYYFEIDKPEISRMIIYNNRYDRSLIFYKKLFEKRGITLVITDQPKFDKGDLYLLELEDITDGYPIGAKLEIIRRFENLIIYKAR